jgi:CheY-like chemotaxis protein
MSSPRLPILVVDDDAEIRQLLATVLTLDGHPALTAGNGREALELARTHHPRLIILDLMMPVMTGEAFRTAQMADASIRDIPVVVLSARHDAAEVASRMKAAGYLSKPLDFDALHTLINRGVGD